MSPFPAIPASPPPSRKTSLFSSVIVLEASACSLWYAPPKLFLEGGGLFFPPHRLPGTDPFYTDRDLVFPVTLSLTLPPIFSCLPHAFFPLVQVKGRRAPCLSEPGFFSLSLFTFSWIRVGTNPQKLWIFLFPFPVYSGTFASCLFWRLDPSFYDWFGHFVVQNCHPICFCCQGSSSFPCPSSRGFTFQLLGSSCPATARFCPPSVGRAHVWLSFFRASVRAVEFDQCFFSPACAPLFHPQFLFFFIGHSRTLRDHFL